MWSRVPVPIMPVTIRHAEPDDAAAIAGIYNQGIADRGATFETVPRTANDLIPQNLTTRRRRDG